MSEYYSNSIIPKKLRRSFDVYVRLTELGVDLGERDSFGASLRGKNIAALVFHESGLAYLSGKGLGDGPVTNQAADVTRARASAQGIADHHIRVLHWALRAGDEGGDLNDVLYTVKALGMVVSADLSLRVAPAVVDGYSARWQSVFGGSIGAYAVDGADPGGYAGVHARSAIGGFDGCFALEPEIIVALPPELCKAIISKRGWTFPLAPEILAS